MTACAEEARFVSPPAFLALLHVWYEHESLTYRLKGDELLQCLSRGRSTDNEMASEIPQDGLTVVHEPEPGTPIVAEYNSLTTPAPLEQICILTALLTAWCSSMDFGVIHTQHGPPTTRTSFSHHRNSKQRLAQMAYD